ncbi:hypothetical protein T09_14966 [Trichinella sp. T9]|nr:hypothetical protein T09_14966 [Trichinella sp. T9]
MQRRVSSSCRKVVTQLSVENYDDTLIVDYINATTVTAETGIKACPPVPACFHKDYQWNRIPRVEHGGHQFHHGIGLYPPVGVFESHGQSLRFCACRLVADMKDTNVAEAKTFSPTTLLLRAESKTPCAEWEQAVNAPRWSRSDGHVKPGRTNVGRKATGIAVATLHGLASHIHSRNGPHPVKKVIRQWITAATVSQVDHHISERCSSQTSDSYRRPLKRKYILAMYFALGTQIVADCRDRGRYGYASGYASGNFSKISKFLKYSPRLCPQATPQGK